MLYNQDAEFTILGTIIMQNHTYAKLQGYLKPEHFNFEDTAKLYEYIEKTLLEKGFIDGILLSTYPDKNLIANCLAFANTIIDIVCYAQEVVELYLKRKFDALTSKLKVSLTSKSFEETKNELLEEIFSLDIEKQNDPVKLVDGIADSIDRENKNQMIFSYYDNIDKLTNGFELGSLVIIGGKPSSGKTTFALCLAMEMSNFHSLCFFSVEVKDKAIFRKYLNNKAEVATGKLKSHSYNQSEFFNLQKIVNSEKENPKNFWVDGTKKLTISLIRSKLKKLILKNKQLDAIFIDYLQLMTPEGKDFSREQQIAKIAIGLKQIATEFNVVVFALSQLSRSSDARENKRPVLSDLRDSGSIEASADIVMFVHREHYYLTQNKPPEHNQEKFIEWQRIAKSIENDADIIIAKNRDGETGDLKFTFNKQFSKFMEATNNDSY